MPPVAGDIWRYDYLWRRQHVAGETEGRKPRAVSLVAAARGAAGRTHLFLSPITSQPPGSTRPAVEIQEIERRRAGLDDLPLWVMLGAYNYDVLELSYYFDGDARIGRFSAEFHAKTLRAFRDIAKARRTARVPRRCRPLRVARGELTRQTAGLALPRAGPARRPASACIFRLNSL